MQVLSEAEEPNPRVGHSLLESRPHRTLLPLVHLVSKQSAVGEHTLLLAQPTGGQGRVWQKWIGEQSDEAGGRALDNEEPLPAGVSFHPVQLEDSRRDETSEGGREDVAGVEDGNSRRDFGSSVEVGDDEDGARIVRGLDDAQEESRQEQAGKVFGESGADRQHRPSHHEHAKEKRHLDTGEEHVRGDTGEDIADEKDRDASLVLPVVQAEVGYDG